MAPSEDLTDGGHKQDAKVPMHCAIEPEKTREAALLGLKLVDWFFGSLNHSIAKTLNEHGRLNFKELVAQVTSLREKEEGREGRVSAEAVRVALVTLIRQNCVVVNEWKSVAMSGRPERSEYLYELDMPRTLNMLRLPLFSRVLQTTVPLKQLVESRAVIQALWNDGRLSLDDLVEKSVGLLRARWHSQAEGDGAEGDSDADHGEDSGVDGNSNEGGRASPKASKESDSHLRTMTDEELVEHMRDMVNDMINRQLIEKAPACGLSPPEDFVHENAQKKKAASREPEGEDEVQENALKLQGQAVREYHSTNRFVREDTWGKPSRKGRYKVSEGNKSYHVQIVATQPGQDKAVNIDPEDQIWRVNFQELNRRVYNGIAVETIRTGIDSIDGLDTVTCGKVVEAMLYKTQSPEPVKSDHASVVPIMCVSQSLSIKDICIASKEIHKEPLEEHEIRGVTEALLGDSYAEAEEKEKTEDEYAEQQTNDGLEGSSEARASSSKLQSADQAKKKRRSQREALGAAAVPALPPLYPSRQRKLPHLSSCLIQEGSVKQEGIKVYRFDTPTALKIARTSKLLEIIEQRFGPSGKRIWNMLYTEGQMEQKAISQDSMLGNTRPREILYAMFRNGFVSLQDIPRNADRAPSRTFYTWRATMPSSIITTAVMLYKSASNVLKMLQDLLTSSELNDINKRIKMSLGYDTQVFEEIHFKKLVLVDNLLMLDEEIALFQFDRNGQSARLEGLERVLVEEAPVAQGTKRRRASATR